MGICNTDDPGALAEFGFPDHAPPFLVEANVLSAKHSFRSLHDRPSPSSCTTSVGRLLFKRFHSSPVKRIHSLVHYC